jgi:hypothetical protein
MLLILSPRFQEYDDLKVNCEEKINVRLLLFLLKKEEQYKIVAINSKAIPNVQDYMDDPFIKIQEKEHGILLTFLTGSSRRCKSEFYFEKYKNDFVLRRVSALFYLIDLSKEKSLERNYKFNPKNDLRTINMNKLILDLNSKIDL